jgi:hypothetical protein
VALSALADGENVPLPEVLQLPWLPPTVTDPFRLALLPSQTVMSLPALTTGSGVMVIVVWWVRTTQPLVLVSVRVAVPALTAEAFGVKTAFSAFAFGEKLPGPLHTPVLPPAVTEPFSWAVLPEQIVCEGPAFTTGAGVIVRMNDALVAEQGVLLVEVSVMVTLPAVMSAALGV